MNIQYDFEEWLSSQNIDLRKNPKGNMLAAWEAAMQRYSGKSKHSNEPTKIYCSTCNDYVDSGHVLYFDKLGDGDTYITFQCPECFTEWKAKISIEITENY